jgi:hypothetical protein
LRTFLALAAGTIVGLAGGFALGIFFYPYIFLADIVGQETADTKQKVLARGTFIHANPRDPVHYGKGKVTIYEKVLHLEKDFEVGPGPKYHVYLVPDANVTPSTEVPKTMFVDLGRLKAFKGGQNYEVPAGVDVARYGSAVIWCEQFGVLISPARLSPGS